MQQKKVTIVFPSIDYRGGLERVLSELVKFLASNGYEVNIIASTIDPELTSFCKHFYQQPALYRGASHLRSFISQIAWIWRSTKLIKNNRESLGVVICSPGYTWIADVCFSGSCHLAAMVEQCKHGNFIWILNPRHWLSILSELVLYHVTAQKIIIPGVRTGKEIHSFLRVPEKNIYLVPHGIDPEIFKYTPEKKEFWREYFSLPKKFIAITVANELRRKGCFEVVQSIVEIKKQRDDIHYVIAGRDNYAEIKGLISRAGLDENVTLLDSQSSTNLSALYCAADIFIFPTIYEAFALVSIESMACGNPVIACKVSGIEDYLIEGKNGLYIQRTLQSIANTILKLMNDPSLVGKLSKGAAETGSHYPWQRVLEKVPPILNSVVQRRF